MRLIDADELIESIKEELWHWDTVDGINATTVLKQTISDINNMTSAQPERKRGKWIDYVNSHCECSVCHTEWSYFQNETECFEFCPNCGADMREVDDERPD